MRITEVGGFNRFSVAALCIVTGFAFVSSGCSTLLNPYVRAEELDSKPSEWGSDGLDRLDKTIEGAIEQRKMYYKAIGERAKLRNGLPLVLMPLSAALLYRGITTTTSAGRQLMLEAGLLGATAYGVANYYLGSSRERIYLAGTHALSCAIHAVEPYMIGRQRYDIFKSDLRNLEREIKSVKDSRDRLNVRLEPLAKEFEDHPYVKQSRQQFDIAAALVARGEEVKSSALKVDAKVQGAAGALRLTVGRIADQVNNQIEQTDADISSILRITQTLSTSGAQLAHVAALQDVIKVPGKAVTDKQLQSAGKSKAESDAKQARQKQLVDDAETAYKDLETATRSLSNAMLPVSEFVRDLTAAIEGAGGLDICAVAQVAGALTVSPDLASIELEPGQAYQFRVNTGNGLAPDAVIVGLVGNDVLEVKKDPGGGPVWLVKVEYKKDKAPNFSETRLELREAGLRTPPKVVVIKLKPAVPTLTEKPGAQTKPSVEKKLDDNAVGPPNARDAYERGLTIGALKRIQTALGVRSDGVFGTETRDAIKLVQKALKDKKFADPGMIEDGVLGPLTNDAVKIAKGMLLSDPDPNDELTDEFVKKLRK